MDMRNSPLLLIAVLFLGTVHISTARDLSPCQIARELYAHGIPEYQINDWVCLVMRESNGDTRKEGRLNRDGSVDYGLFQINGNIWCDQPGRGCNISCRELLTDDISVAVECAKKIKHIQGFEAWTAWDKYCRPGSNEFRGLEDFTSCLHHGRRDCCRGFQY